LNVFANAINCPFSTFAELLSKGEKTEAEILEGKHNPPSNLCLFRYNDDKKIYTKPQKCMVHQDDGLMTLLPRYFRRFSFKTCQFNLKYLLDLLALVLNCWMFLNSIGSPLN